MRAWRTSVSLALVVGATIVSLGSTPRAQVAALNPVVNAKQRLLAGEPLPVNMAALHSLAAARQRPAFAPGRVVMKLVASATDEVAIRWQGTPARTASRDRARRTSSSSRCLSTPTSSRPRRPWPLNRASSTRSRIRSRCSPTSRTIRSIQSQWNFQSSTWSARGTSTAAANRRSTVAVIDSGVAYIDQGAFRQAPDLAGATFVVAARLHLGRRHAGRSRGPRDARHGHDRRAHRATISASPAWHSTSRSCQ